MDILGKTAVTSYNKITRLRFVWTITGTNINFIIMSSTMGIGCLFAFIPILLLQGSITALAKVCEPILHIGTAISDLSLVGAVMIFCIGVNLSFGKKFRAGNMLPALVIAVIWAVVEHYL